MAKKDNRDLFDYEKRDLLKLALAISSQDLKVEEFLKRLEDRLGLTLYSTWFRRGCFKMNSFGKITFYTDCRFFYEHIRNRFWNILKELNIFIEFDKENNVIPKEYFERKDERST